jgi:hypothetical protein
MVTEDIKKYIDPKAWKRQERFKESVKPDTWKRMEELFSRRDIDGVINAMLNFSEVAGTGICECDALHWFQGYIADRVKGKNKREIEMCEAIIKAEMKKYPKWDRKQLR